MQIDFYAQGGGDVTSRMCSLKKSVGDANNERTGMKVFVSESSTNSAFRCTSSSSSSSFTSPEPNGDCFGALD